MYLFATNNTNLFNRTLVANSGASWASNPEKGIMVVTTPEQLKRLIPKVESDNEGRLRGLIEGINLNGLKD